MPKLLRCPTFSKSAAWESQVVSQSIAVVHSKNHNLAVKEHFVLLWGQTLKNKSDSTAHISHLKLLILGKLLVTRLTERQRLNLKFIKSLNINKSNIAWAIASDVFDVNKYWFSLIKHIKCYHFDHFRATTTTTGLKTCHSATGWDHDDTSLENIAIY